MIKATVFFPLTQGQVGIVDYDDYVEFICKKKYYANKATGNLSFYIRRSHNYRENGKWKVKTIFLHNEIMKPPKGLVVDHFPIRNGIDCRKKNMRVVTVRKNTQNTIRSERKKSKFYGLTWRKPTAINSCLYIVPTIIVRCSDEQ